MSRVATAVFFLTQLPCSVFSRFCTSVCHILLTGREVTLPCAYRRTCFDIYKTLNSFNYFRLKNKTLVFEISIFYCFTGGAVCVCVFVCVCYTIMNLKRLDRYTRQGSAAAACYTTCRILKGLSYTVVLSTPIPLLSIPPCITNSHMAPPASSIALSSS